MKRTKTTGKQSAAGLEFVAQGVACQCITLLHQIGLIDVLAAKGAVGETDIARFTNPLAVRSAFISLARAGVISETNDVYSFTTLGEAVVQHLGLITMIFDGYGGLLSQQAQLTAGEEVNRSELVKGNSVAYAASALSRQFIEPVVVPLVQSLGVRGSVCDLGCGHGQLLGEMCSTPGTSGLGFEICSEVVRAARSRFVGRRIEIEQGDITNLKGVWEDVSVLVQCHVFHDFIARRDCADLLSSYRATFPNHRYFFYLDTVAATPGGLAALPGFDYVHGLLGLEPPTYDEMLSIFRRSGYMIERENPINGLPNTILWVLRKTP